ncbi:MAG: Rieske 2Fe-2S domain-containing protein [Actinobacteria bacterium]|nr:Rieske 2Fe-2S domain-containing protein [Actinomycetota bacterium]
MALEQAANLDELEIGETLLVELAEPICLVRLGERDVRAIHDTCSHQGQPLHEGTVDGDTIVCAAHAATFDLATGQSVGIPEVAAVPMYACSIEGDAILVDVDKPLNQAKPAVAAG